MEPDWARMRRVSQEWGGVVEEAVVDRGAAEVGLQDVRAREGGGSQEDVAGWRPAVLDGLGGWESA